MSEEPVDEALLEETASRRDALRAASDAGARRLAARQAIVETVGTDDASIVDRIEQLGFSGDSVRVLDLLPLIHVAWADGRVQREERAAILVVAEQRGLPKTSDAVLLVESLLEQRPSETFLAESLALVRDLAEKSGGMTTDIVELCSKVASASGGLFGLGSKVSDTERELIARIAAALAS